MARAVDDETTSSSIANPNNPTGTFARPDELEAFLRKRAASACWWCSTRRTTNTSRGPARRAGAVARALSEPRRHAHLLEGLRPRRPARGLRARAPEVADVMNRVRQPFNVNSIALAAAAAALDDMEFVARSYAVNRAGMRQLEEGVARARPRVHSLARQLRHRAQVGDGAEVFQRLLRRGVIVRPIGAATACPSTCASRWARRRRTSASSPRSRASIERVACGFRARRDHRRRPDRRLVRARAEAGAAPAATSSASAAAPPTSSARSSSASSTPRRPMRWRRRATPTSCCSPCRCAQIPKLLREVAPVLGPKALVTDAGSTKRDVVARRARRSARSISRVRARRIPIAGAEKSGAERRERGALPRARAWCSTPLAENADSRGRRRCARPGRPAARASRA